MTGARGSWRLAGRLARREVRRHPWRHVLVTVLILVPVLAALTAFSAISTYRGVDRQRDHFSYPDLRTVHVRSEQLAGDGGNGQDLRDPQAARSLGLPDGTPTETWWEGADWLYGDRERIDGRGPFLVGTKVIETPKGSTSQDQFVVQHGRLPRNADEVFLTDPLAREGGWALGDTVRSARTDRAFEVVGTGVLGGEIDERAAAVAGLPDSYWTQEVYGVDGVDTGDGAGSTTVATQVMAALVADPVLREELTRGYFDSPDSAQRLDRRVGAGMTLAAAAICAVVAIVASAAFAISSRRQLRSIGLLSTVGTDPATIRRSLLLQGAIPGAIAGVSAVVLAVVVAAAANASSLPERISQVSGARVQISATGALVAVLLGFGSGVAAAWQPARSASRISTLNALGGRRPVGPVPTSVPVGGLILWGCGAAALIAGFGAERAGALEQIQPFLVILGVAAIALGGVGLAPLAVALLAPLAPRVPGIWRMGIRGLTRHRMQSAASVAAIGVVLAIPVGLLTTRNGLDDRNPEPADVCCTVATSTLPPAMTTIIRNPEQATQVVLGGELDTEAGGAAVDEVRDILGSDAASIRTLPLVDQDGRWRDIAVIDEASAATVLDPWAARAIAAGEAVPLQDGPDALTLSAEGETATFDVAAAADEPVVTNLPLSAAYLIGAEALDGVGANRPTPAILIVRPTRLTEDEQNQLRMLSGFDGPGSTWATEPPTLDRIRTSIEQPEETEPGRGAVSVSLAGGSFGSDDGLAEIDVRTPRDEWDTALLVGVTASAILALLVLTITLSLRSVDGETDRRAAYAAGVAPTALRRQRAFEGVVLALLGAVLAVPLGWIPVTAARLGIGRTDDPLSFGEVFALPGLVVIPILLAPAIAAALVWTVVPAAAAAMRSARHRDLRDDLVPRF